MTETEATAEPTPGTAADYMRFLAWAAKTGELPGSTVTNWRIASIKVLEIEENWEDVNVVDLDLDAHIRRFETLKRTSYASASMKAYKSRARLGIESYRAWFAGSDWKPRVSGSVRPTTRNAAKKSAEPATLTLTPAVTKAEGGGFVPQHDPLIEYQLALRPGVRAVLTLPEILTEKDAQRVMRFIQGLAVTDQLAITGGEVPAE